MGQKGTNAFSHISEAGHSKEEDPQVSLETRVTDMIHEIGIPAHIKGYHYLRDAIMMAVEDMDVLNAVTKVLYPTVAKHHQTTAWPWMQIEVAWKGKLDTLDELFGYTVSNGKENRPFRSLLRLLQTHSDWNIKTDNSFHLKKKYDIIFL